MNGFELRYGAGSDIKLNLAHANVGYLYLQSVKLLIIIRFGTHMY
jgi:hypothetical protein